MATGVVAGSSEMLNIGANRQFLKELALELALRMERGLQAAEKGTKAAPGRAHLGTGVRR